jgi:DNA-binding NarL/FixJ family response regulator
MNESNQSHRKNDGVVRILLVDDHPLVREALKNIIRREPDLVVCGEAEDREQALELAAAVEPDMALVDLALKNSHGLELVKDFGSIWPRLKILVLSLQVEAIYAERVIRAGARGYISKQETPGKILMAIRHILAGNIYWSEKAATHVASKIARSSRPGDNLAMEALTDREIQVFELIGFGKSTHEIAAELHINSSTVETYRARIKDKLNIKNAHELLQYAIRCSNDPKF